jgi:hypothetical protein
MVDLKSTAKRGGCHELNGTMESTKWLFKYQRRSISHTRYYLRAASGTVSGTTFDCA